MVIRHFRLKDRKNMNTTFICSDDLAYDVKLAKEYCERREEDVNAFMKTLPAWETREFGKVLQITVRGQSILHELVPGTICPGTPLWGELCVDGDLERGEMIRLKTFENFAAYMLARFW
jgi:hypothetical protein